MLACSAYANVIQIAEKEHVLDYMVVVLLAVVFVLCVRNRSCNSRPSARGERTHKKSFSQTTTKMTNVSTLIKIFVSNVVLAALVATYLSSGNKNDSTVGLKGSRQLQTLSDFITFLNAQQSQQSQQALPVQVAASPVSFLTQ
jgi:hypothetical protein